MLEDSCCEGREGEKKEEKEKEPIFTGKESVLTILLSWSEVVEEKWVKKK